MEIIVVKLLLWYAQDAPWYLAINICLPSTAFSAAFLSFSLFWAHSLLLLWQNIFLFSNSLGLSSSAVQSKHSSGIVHTHLCGPPVAHWEPWGSGSFYISNTFQPACEHEDSLINIDPVRITQPGHTRTPSHPLPPKPEAKPAIWTQKALPTASLHCQSRWISAVLELWISFYRQMSTRN